jgi:hypothetical protein
MGKRSTITQWPLAADIALAAVPVLFTILSVVLSLGSIPLLVVGAVLFLAALTWVLIEGSPGQVFAHFGRVWRPGMLAFVAVFLVILGLSLPAPPTQANPPKGTPPGDKEKDKPIQVAEGPQPPAPKAPTVGRGSNVSPLPPFFSPQENPKPDDKKPNDKKPDDKKPIADGVLAPGVRPFEDIRLTEFTLDSRTLAPCLFWAADGKSFYCLNKDDGTVRRIALDGFKELAKRSVDSKCIWLAPSAEGLLLSTETPPSFSVLDPVTLEEKSKCALPAGYRAVSGWNLSFAYVGMNQQDGTPRGFAVWDLKKGKWAAELLPRQFKRDAGFDHPQVTPDGKYLVARGGNGGIHRYRLDGAKVILEQSSPGITNGATRELHVSIDSTWICLPTGGGNEPQYSTQVYALANLTKPALVFKQGAFPQAVGFDPVAKKIFAQDSGVPLKLFGYDGQPGKTYQFETQGESAHQFLVHPEGRKLLILGDRHLYYVEIPKQ